MLHLLLLPSFYVSGSVRQTTMVHVLPEYHFQAGGGMQMNVNASSLAGVSLYVVPKVALNILFRGPDVEVFCNHTFDAIFPPRDPLKVKEIENGWGVTWKLHVRVKGVFIPILTNCRKLPLDFAIQYANPGNLLDVRDQPIPQLYYSLSFAYTLIMCVWLWNGLRFSQFRVDLHTLFAVAALSKAVSSYFKGRYWVCRMASDFVTGNIVYQSVSVWVAAHSILLMANALGALGWGTSRERLTGKEFLHCGLLSVFFCGGIAASMESQSGFIIVVLLMTLIVGMLYALMLYWALDRALYLLDHIDGNLYPIVHKKLGVQVWFCNVVFLYILAVNFVSQMVLIFNDCFFVKIIVCELAIIGLFLVDMRAFLLRVEYSGDTEEVERVEADNLEIVEATDQVVLLDEPNNDRELCVVSAEV